jgi:hypothetical protein
MGKTINAAKKMRGAIRTGTGAPLSTHLLPNRAASSHTG